MDEPGPDLEAEPLSASLAAGCRECTRRTDPRFLRSGRHMVATTTPRRDRASEKRSGGPTSQNPVVLDAPPLIPGSCPMPPALLGKFLLQLPPCPMETKGPCLMLMLFETIAH